MGRRQHARKESYVNGAKPVIEWLTEYSPSPLANLGDMTPLLRIV